MDAPWTLVARYNQKRSGLCSIQDRIPSAWEAVHFDKPPRTSINTSPSRRTAGPSTGTKPPKVKPFCVVLDFVDVAGRHQLNTAASIFGLSPKFDLKGKSATDVVEEVETLKAKSPAINLSLYDDIEGVRGVAEAMDLFAVPVVPPEITVVSKLSWTSGVAAGTYQLVLPDKGLLQVRQNTLGEWEAFKSTSGVRRTLATEGSLRGAISACRWLLIALARGFGNEMLSFVSV